MSYSPDRATFPVSLKTFLGFWKDSWGGNGPWADFRFGSHKSDFTYCTKDIHTVRLIWTERYSRESLPSWAILAPLVMPVIILQQIRSHWFLILFFTVISYTIPMSVGLFFLCFHMRQLHWLFTDWIAMYMVANTLWQCTWKGLWDTWHFCVWLYVRMPMWIRRCPGGPLFSVGPSNPFKSALLIPLSSHSCCGFMQAHRNILTTVHTGCIFCSIQRSTDIFWNMFFAKSKTAVSFLSVHPVKRYV